MRGRALKSRLPVKGIQCASSQAASVRTAAGLASWSMTAKVMAAPWNSLDKGREEKNNEERLLLAPVLIS